MRLTDRMHGSQFEEARANPEREAAWKRRRMRLKESKRAAALKSGAGGAGGRA